MLLNNKFNFLVILIIKFKNVVNFLMIFIKEDLKDLYLIFKILI